MGSDIMTEEDNEEDEKENVKEKTTYQPNK